MYYFYLCRNLTEWLNTVTSFYLTFREVTQVITPHFQRWLEIGIYLTDVWHAWWHICLRAACNLSPCIRPHHDWCQLGETSQQWPATSQKLSHPMQTMLNLVLQTKDITLCQSHDNVIQCFIINRILLGTEFFKFSTETYQFIGKIPNFV